MISYFEKETVIVLSPEEMKRHGLLRIFMSFYRPHWKLFVLDMVCAFSIALVDLAFPLVSRAAMNELLPGRLFETFFVVMAVLLGAYVLKFFLHFIVTYWGHDLGARIEADVRKSLFSHMQSLSFSFFDKNRTGGLMSRLTGDLFEMTELAHHGPEDVFISLTTLVGSYIFMFMLRWELALVLFLMVPIVLLFTVFVQGRLLRDSVRVKERLGNISSDIESSISGVRVAKAFGNEPRETEKFLHSNQKYRYAKRSYYKSMAVYYSGLELFMGIMPVLVIAVGGYLAMAGKMELVDLITFSLFVTVVLNPIRRITAFTETFVQGAAGFQRVVELMRIDPIIRDADDAEDLENAQGDIRVEDISFSYETGGEPVLEHVSLHVMPGETVAVVGPSGGGKSTLCQLIPRFYDVTEGRILVDGKDVRQLTQQSLHESIGIVQQDVFLFADTIYENIRYGRLDATEAEIMEAAKEAEIYDEIMEMPDGFQTYVGERGTMLSGGQKQRISIARIFLKNPPVLILDEATSALDSITEAHIQSAFDKLSEGRTTLIIAHRLSTIRTASRILVIDGAGIAEEGTHEELLRKGGEYTKLYRSQQMGQADG